MKKIKLFIAIFLALFLASCSAAPNGGGDAQNGNVQGGGTGNNQIVIPEGHKIIYTVEYTIVIENELSTSINEINAKLYELDGYISSSKQSFSNGTFVYKIPTEKLNDFLNHIDSYNGVKEKSINSEDVTTSYNEILAEMETLEASKKAYENMLANDSLTMSQIIEINKEIESLNTRLKSLGKSLDNFNERIDYATITIKYYLGSQEPAFLSGYGDFLLDVGKGIIEFLAYTAPFALIASGTVVIIYFYKKKKQPKK